MKIVEQQIRLAATDLSNHLACHHVTSLDLSVARAQRSAPEWRSPDLFVIQELGLRHEAAYVDSLRRAGAFVEDLRETQSEHKSLAATRMFMERGVDVIAQGTIAEGRWFGRPDVLRKVVRPSRFGEWSYEAYDCKLSRETKATTILQLALYSALLAEIQGEDPEFMHVVPPGKGFVAEAYRFAEYAAYYRYVKARLEKACDNGDGSTYPEPCAHCDICRWFRICDAQRHADDHLSLVAGITLLQRKQFSDWQAETVQKLARLPIPLKKKPLHGSRETYERTREQARVQVAGRGKLLPVYELLPITAEGGFCRLPEPSRGDVFVDLEGDPFAAEGGRQYLFGFVSREERGDLSYAKRWCFTAQEERSAFEWCIDEIMRRWKSDPAMHIYHFGGYEPAHLKTLMGRYATREDEVDRMLRARLLVDLHTIFKQAVRAGVEEYSLKALEGFHGFARGVPLAESREAMRFVEHGLELGWDEGLPERLRKALEGYNEDDCRSTAALRDWLEAERAALEARGTAIPRPETGDGAPSEELDERQKRVAAMVERLITDVPLETAERSNEQAARWMLAQLLDWHRREDKAAWWEGYRLADLDDEHLMDERVALTGLRFQGRVGVEGKSPIERYAFDKQETEVRCDKDLYHRRERVGRVVAMDLVKRTIDIKKTKAMVGIHPTNVYMWDRPIDVSQHAESLFRTAGWVAENGVDSRGRYRAARDLLLRKAPNLRLGERIAPLPGEGPLQTACRVATALNDSVFAIQGPPGAGKTYTGARMICRLVKEGRKVGVTALSHKVIRKLLNEVVDAANEGNVSGVKCLELTDEKEEARKVLVTKDNALPLQALRSGAANVVGGTSWLWARPEYFEAVDALFVDEAGQMALADVIAVAQAAKNVVLIGDPQQLERPLKGSHPPGAEKSALEHLLGERKTISDDMGLLLPQTWRMHPGICGFTSELFYDGRLAAHDLTRNRVLEGHPWLTGAGLWFVPVAHEGNRNSSPEEVETVAKIVAGLLRPEVKWFYGIGNSRPLTFDDVLIVAPYNAQVLDLSERLPQARVGTVDKFQGQEAAVVIYSLTTSSPEDAPRGMEFLFSLNRLNVATSRGMSAVIVVGNPRLFEPECHSPRQMRLANAFCRFAEMARIVDLKGLEESRPES